MEVVEVIEREIKDKLALMGANRGMNIGIGNSGDYNVGNYNRGKYNVGRRNEGYANIGNNNSGSHNIGNLNTGDDNIGSYNAGDRNTGYFNIGNGNTGNGNSGNRNTGDWNITSHNTGCFNTVDHEIFMFNRPSKMKYSEWLTSEARTILNTMPFMDWIDDKKMTDQEKIDNPHYNTVGGYLRVSDKGERQVWWNELSESDRCIVKRIPNFDADIFYACTGIRISD